MVVLHYLSTAEVKVLHHLINVQFLKLKPINCFQHDPEFQTSLEEILLSNHFINQHTSHLGETDKSEVQFQNSSTRRIRFGKVRNCWRLFLQPPMGICSALLVVQADCGSQQLQTWCNELLPGVSKALSSHPLFQRGSRGLKFQVQLHQKKNS